MLLITETGFAILFSPFIHVLNFLHNKESNLYPNTVFTIRKLFNTNPLSLHTILLLLLLYSKYCVSNL